ncbi:GFA family protein [Thalassomonas viridans]|uniref:GFA family protein n=1 Tax=Thalassomonas viridans TaxID=137584 RepID=A0AAE9ZAF9_9GAMM|nr:GFA family protein [Thalassomonas viridans]WDE08902.1 GFA family protein [Thalassomonas viridans]WDE08949.1 GFA family protein [Thalassomonas viridans]
MKITGGCHCGELKYQARIDPDKVLICHCTDCQQLSGTAFRTVVVSEPDGLIFTRGQAKEYIKTAESGNKRAQGFCANCGSAIYATSADKSNRIYGIRVGSVHQRNELVPSSQIWCRSSVPWLEQLPDMTEYETVPTK